MARNSPGLLALRLLIARRLLRGLKLLHGLLKAAHDAFECDNFRGSVVQLISGVERVLGHEPLQKIDVALKAPRSLVQAGGFRAVLYSGDILRAPGFNSDDDQAQAQHRDSDHALLSIPICCHPARRDARIATRFEGRGRLQRQARQGLSLLARKKRLRGLRTRVHRVARRRGGGVADHIALPAAGDAGVPGPQLSGGAFTGRDRRIPSNVAGESKYGVDDGASRAGD